jgi:hypothetical protein
MSRIFLAMHARDLDGKVLQAFQLGTQRFMVNSEDMIDEITQGKLIPTNGAGFRMGRGFLLNGSFHIGRADSKFLTGFIQTLPAAAAIVDSKASKDAGDSGISRSAIAQSVTSRRIFSSDNMLHTTTP